MSNQLEKKPNLLIPILIVVAVVLLVAGGSYFAFREQTEIIQGQAEVTEYRVSSKVPSRIMEIRVKAGDYVHAGDTLALLEAPEVDAKLQQARAVQAAAQAQENKAEKGAREEQIRGAYEMWQKAKAGVEIAEKSYTRIKNLFEQGVVTAQKLDEVTAQRDAAIATERAAQSQYDMAKNGAQTEDKSAARALVEQARGAVREVNAYVRETVLVAQKDGEVTDVYPEVGELVGTGAPIMSIAETNDIWVTFNVREDHLQKFAMNQIIEATVPAVDDNPHKFIVYYSKDLGTYAAWKATKTTGQYDMKTFEVRARPADKIEGLRAGMSVLLK
ncbi:MAG: efflux RND transporter periplasmic adaptor subunit [Bacteroidaceae bacterium]|nr:efflux RND transporter periplasmic adaptor subunit [Bacteroidaceae bacterium]